MPRVKPYVMQLRDTDRGVYLSSDTYEQWGFHHKAFVEELAQPPAAPCKLTGTLCPRLSRHPTESNRVVQVQMASETQDVIVRDSGVPGAQVLGDSDMASVQRSTAMRALGMCRMIKTDSWGKSGGKRCLDESGNPVLPHRCSGLYSNIHI
ncbi:hypothetical protein DFH29DRAFT_22653 [Suillus ampliporus]|nr:hypothetical protein DFH29DRAFT_22653 [Suillus ampliporus]